MALESACLPVPSELVMPFSGYLASTGRFSLLLAATAGAVGCNVGSTVVYFAGATGGRTLVEKWGRYVFLGKTDMNRVEKYFERYGAITIFFARVLPMVPAIVSLPAGMARMPLWKFEVYTFAGCWLWCFALAFLGFKFGQAWNTDPWLKSVLDWLDLAVAGLAVLGLAWFAWRIWSRTPGKR